MNRIDEQEQDMSEAAEKAWLEHRNANSRHNVPYGQPIFLAGYAAAQVVPQPNRDKLREALTTVRGIVKRNYRDAYDIVSIIDIALSEPAPALSPAPLTIDRDSLFWVIDKAFRNSWSEAMGHERSPMAITDAVIAYLSAQPVEGEVGVTDDMVNKAWLAYWAYIDSRRPAPEIQERGEAAMRAALEAARGAVVSDMTAVDPGAHGGPIPWYAMLDAWMALGLDSQDFDSWYAERGYAEAWAELMGAIRVEHTQLRAAQEAIAEAKAERLDHGAQGNGYAQLVQRIREHLDRADTSALAAVKAEAWDKGVEKAFYDATYTFDGLLELNPYRAASIEQEGADRG